MEMEMSAMRAVIAAMFSAPTYCLCEHRRSGGGMDRVLSLIGSKSKPPLLSLPQPANQRADQSTLTLRLTISRLPPQPQTYRKEISSFHSGFLFFIWFFPPTLSLQSTRLFSLHTGSAALLSLSNSPLCFELANWSLAHGVSFPGKIGN